MPYTAQDFIDSIPRFLTLTQALDDKTRKEYGRIFRQPYQDFPNLLQYMLNQPFEWQTYAALPLVVSQPTLKRVLKTGDVLRKAILIADHSVLDTICNLHKEFLENAQLIDILTTNQSQVSILSLAIINRSERGLGVVVNLYKHICHLLQLREILCTPFPVPKNFSPGINSEQEPLTQLMLAAANQNREGLALIIQLHELLLTRDAWKALLQYQTPTYRFTLLQVIAARSSDMFDDMASLYDEYLSQEEMRVAWRHHDAYGRTAVVIAAMHCVPQNIVKLLQKQNIDVFSVRTSSKRNVQEFLADILRSTLIEAKKESWSESKISKIQKDYDDVFCVLKLIFAFQAPLTEEKERMISYIESELMISQKLNSELFRQTMHKVLFSHIFPWVSSLTLDILFQSAVIKNLRDLDIDWAGFIYYLLGISQPANRHERLHYENMALDYAARLALGAFEVFEKLMLIVGNKIQTHPDINYGNLALLYHALENNYHNMLDYVSKHSCDVRVRIENGHDLESLLLLIIRKGNLKEEDFQSVFDMLRILKSLAVFQSEKSLSVTKLSAQLESEKIFSKNTGLLLNFMHMLLKENNFAWLPPRVIHEFCDLSVVKNANNNDIEWKVTIFYLNSADRNAPCCDKPSQKALFFLEKLLQTFTADSYFEEIKKMILAIRNPQLLFELSIFWSKLMRRNFTPETQKFFQAMYLVSLNGVLINNPTPNLQGDAETLIKQFASKVSLLAESMANGGILSRAKQGPVPQKTPESAQEELFDRVGFEL